MAAVLVAVGLGTAAQAAPSDPKSPASPTPLSGAERAAAERSDRATPVLDKARQLGESADAAAYAGEGYDPATARVIVWRVGGNNVDADPYKALATADVPVTVKDALVSERDKEALYRAVADDMDSLAAEGIEITTVGLTYITAATPQPLQIGVKPGTLTPAIAETLLSRYADKIIGRDKVVVTEIAPAVNLSGPQNDGPL